jgi:hypothetical protein
MNIGSLLVLGSMGLRVEVASTYLRENSYSKADRSTSFLDLDEAKDLDGALFIYGADRAEMDSEPSSG